MKRAALRPAVLLTVLTMMLVGPSARPQADEDGDPLPTVEIVFEGNGELSESTLRRELVDPLLDVERRGARPADVDDAAYELTLLYLDNGHAFAEVDWSIDDPAPDLRVVTFHLDEGPRVVVASIDVSGNTEIDGATLAALYEAPATGLLGGGDKLFIRSQVDLLTSEIERLYRASGYDEVAVTRPEVSFEVDRTQARVSLVVTEGPAFEVASITFSGNEIVPDDVVARVVAPLVGDRFRRRLLFELRARVESLLADNGFPEAQVEVVEAARDPAGMVALHVTIVEGQRVTIGRVLVEGQDETDRDFIRERIPFRPGDLWNGRVEREVSRALLATGLFRSVSAGLEGDGPVRDFVVRVEDAKSLELYVKPGYGAYERARLSVGLRENNLFGTGRSANLEVGASTKGEFAQLTFSDPWLLGDNMVLSAPLSYRRREEPSFTDESQTIGAHVRKRWSSDLSSTVGAEYQISTVSDVDPDVEDDLGNDSQVFSLFGNLRHDTRDNIFNPTEGHVRRAFLEYGLPLFGANLEFVRAEGSVAHYWGLSEHVVLAVSARSGFIVPTGSSEEIPLQYRYFNGGQDSVRSFKYSELGPKDSEGNPVGGESVNTVNLEVRYNWTQAWQTAAFFDYGNVGFTTSDYFDDFREGIGVGLRYLLPVGSVRFDLAVNPDPRKDEDHWVAQLAIGMAF